MNANNIPQTIWSQIDKSLDTRPQQDGSDHSIEYQLARVGIFDDIEKIFEQRPAAELKVKNNKERVHVLDSRKAYNLSEYY